MAVLVRVVLALGVLLAFVAPATAADRPVRERALAEGLVQQLWRHGGPAGDVHVARADAKGAGTLRVVPSAGLRGRETTSALCRRTPGCRVAVNGDYFGPDGPRGGVVADGRLLRSPGPGHLFLQTGPVRAVVPTAQEPGWSGTVRDSAGEFRLAGVNVAGLTGLVLWTSAYDTRTPDCACHELTLRRMGGDPVDLLGGASRWQVVALREGGASDLRAGPVLAATGTDVARLERLAAAGEVVVGLAKGAPQGLGAHPVVLRDGQVVTPDAADTVQHERHPRTALGWHPDGRRWVLVADGRREGAPGLTAEEVARVLLELGASDAALLDGGGSSTFVVDGKVANRPSDKVERPVSNALMLVVEPSATAPAAARPTPVALRAAPPAPAPAPPAPAAVAPVAAPAVAAPAAPAPPVVARKVPTKAPALLEVVVPAPAPVVDTAEVVAVAAAAIAAAVEADPALRPALPPARGDRPAQALQSAAVGQSASGPVPAPQQVAALLLSVVAVLVGRSAAAVRAELRQRP